MTGFWRRVLNPDDVVKQTFFVSRAYFLSGNRGPGFFKSTETVQRATRRNFQEFQKTIDVNFFR